MAEKESKSLVQVIDTQEFKIQEVLPEGQNSEADAKRVVRLARLAIVRNPDLLKCTRAFSKTFLERELRAMQPLDPIAMASLLNKAGLELDDIEVLFENARLNLDDFVKTGQPFKTFRMYDSREE